jgi:23S rRNA (uracil1939-C5)-methyltransferase
MSAGVGRGRAGARLAELDEIEVVVEKLVTGGDGLARFENIPIFVPRSAPGDRLRVRLTERRPDYGRAEIVDVLEPGPHRREPPCPHFLRCGGCDLQHLEDAAQVELKAAAVRETLRRLGGVELPTGIPLLHGAPWSYRLRTAVHTESSPEGVRVGYFARRSRELVAIHACPILDPELESAVLRLPEILTPGKAPRRLDMAVGAAGELTVSPLVDGLPHGAIHLPVGQDVYQFDARCFFQAHRELLPLLVSEAVGSESGGTAFDLYAGVGLFSIALSRNYDRVVAVEGDRIAARYARIAGRKNGARGLEVEVMAVENWMEQLPEDAERVVVDPPRGGLLPKVRRGLLMRRPRHVTYVSCDAATLARDLRALKRLYRIDRIALIDLFPQTGHMETVAQLVRLENGGAS